MPALAICGKVTWPLRKMIALGGVPINVALREKRLTLLVTSWESAILSQKWAKSALNHGFWGQNQGFCPFGLIQPWSPLF